MRKLKQHIINFIKLESASGVILLMAALLAAFLANSQWSTQYFFILEYKILNLSLAHWISDGLMAIFFFVVGLEIKREIVAGELSSIEKASLPIVAALGGMVVPALIYLFFNQQKPEAGGWAIPMATDIAFAMGVLSLFGKRVPLNLKIFLLALAVVDDLGAVLVIALFYTKQISYLWLCLGLFGVLTILLLQKIKISHYGFYILLGTLVWAGFLLSGVHATIAGVILGLITPFKFNKNSNPNYSPVEEIIHFMHPWVSYFIMPIFALANAGISLGDGVSLNYFVDHQVVIGIVLGLVMGKPMGILLFSYIFNKLGLARLPSGVNFLHLSAAACAAGIGFTMSIFISNLAFQDQNILAAKIGIVVGSVASAALATMFLASIFKLSKV